MIDANETKALPAIAADIDLTNPVNGRLVLTFGNGKALTLQASDITPEIATMATFHGLKQKLVDAAAISRNPETGRSATIEDKFDAVKEVYDRLIAGQWNKARGEGASAGGLLFKALCRMYGDKTPDQIRAYLAKKTDAEKTALRANPKVATLIAAIRAETDKPSNIDTDALLDELDEAE